MRSRIEVFKVVRTVAVRKSQDKPIPPDTVQRIVEAARLTGSGMNAQPWHFIVVEDRETLHKLGQIVQTGRSIAQATLAIVVAIDKTRLSVSDTSRAIQSMILTAWSEGVGSNWTGFMGLQAGLSPLVYQASLKAGKIKSLEDLAKDMLKFNERI